MGRQTVSGLIFSRGGNSLTVREHKLEDGKVRHCNRVGCSASVYSMNDKQIGKPEKSQFSDVQSQTGSSSKSFPWHFRKSQQETRIKTTNQQSTISEKSASHGRLGKLEGNSRNVKGISGCIKKKEIQKSNPEPSKQESKAVPSSCENGSKRSRNSTSSLGNKLLKRVSKQPISGSQPKSSSSNRWSYAYKNAIEAPKHASEDFRTKPQTNGSKSLIHSAMSNVVPSVFSSSESGLGKRVSTLRKKSSVGTSLSAKGKSSSASLNYKSSGSSQRIVTGTSTPDNLCRKTSRRTSSTQTSSSSVLSVRTSRVSSRGTRMELSQQVDYSILSPNASSTPQQPQIEDLYSESSSRFSVEFPVEGDVDFQSGRRNQTTSGGSQHVPLADQNSRRHLNIRGAAEVLLTLERIEQDDDLSYEHLLMIGNNLISEGLNFYDQHRDMRMDIDNMSYEELLALEERIGTVSTALPEEALSKCMKRIGYTPCSVPGTPSHEVEIRCSICQEEYVAGEELGKLVCNHSYHVTCIHQWLQFKNWCPICKASLSSSS